jgi:hypothetical protein
VLPQSLREVEATFSAMICVESLFLVVFTGSTYINDMEYMKFIFLSLEWTILLYTFLGMMLLNIVNGPARDFQQRLSLSMP